jgi:salicylate hydroxylase
MVPHQGQGANQTIEDAIVLADCLGADADVPATLARYETCRRARTTDVQRLSRLTADLLHVPDGPDIPGRDAAFANLYKDLAWIHAHDAHATSGSGDLASQSA